MTSFQFIIASKFVRLWIGPKGTCIRLYIVIEASGCIIRNYFSYFSIKTYVKCTQKNHLNKTFLLITPPLF